MKGPRSLERSPEVLSESVRTRLLERATELDSAYRASGLSSGQAAELARPYLGLLTNTVTYSPERTPGELTIRATREQIDNVRAALDKNDGAGSPACAR